MRCLLYALLWFATVACGSSPATTEPTTALQVRLVKTVTLTTDADGGSARPEIVATANRVFVLFLGNIAGGGNRTFDLRIYDRDLNTVLGSRTLVSTTAQYGGPTDIRVAADGQYLYAFYETHKPTSPTAATTWLWGAKFALDDNFARVAFTAPIASSSPMSELGDGGELLDDPAPLVGPTSVFIVTRLKYSIARAGRTVYRVREFSKADLTRLFEFDLDLSSVADGRARVTSLLFWNNSILMALATTVSDQGVNESNDDGALSDVILVRLRPDWTLDPQRVVQTVSAEANDRENYVSGFDTDGELFYVTYKQAVGSPPSGEQRAWIKMFDGDFKRVLAEQVKSTGWGPSGGEIRPSLEVLGNRIFSGQSSGQGLGAGNAELFVYEVVGK
ncbi:MAG TPA: hypothetical protein VJL28_05295 [Gemmatimonadaceae bacterium]|nr:hypothetical protein [Gemmatimonadaceae bacterium]